MRIVPVKFISEYKQRESSKNFDFKKNVHVCKQIDELPRTFNFPITFTRKWSEHKSWGAQIDPKTKEASFNFSLSNASFNSSYFALSIGNIPQ